MLVGNAVAASQEASHQVVEGWAISVLNGQRWETKLHSAKADGVRLHWVKDGAGRVWERWLSRQGSNSEDATGNDTETEAMERAKQVARSTKHEARSTQQGRPARRSYARFSLVSPTR